MKTIVTLALGALALAALHTVNAHPQTYVNATGDQLLDCNPDALPDGSDPGVFPFDSQGGVCYPAGHILGTTSTITINDDFVNPASMFICQDKNANGQCPDEADGEFAILACGSQKLTSGVNWTPGIALLIWLDGPLFGSPALSVCGNVVEGTGSSLSPAITGSVTHT